MTSKANSSPRTDSQLMQFSTTNISPELLANFSSIICLFQAIFNSMTASIPTTHKDKDLVVGGLNTCPTNPASYLHWKIEKKNILSAVAWPISMKFGTLIQVFRLVVNLQKEHRGKILELTMMRNCLCSMNLGCNEQEANTIRPNTKSCYKEKEKMQRWIGAIFPYFYQFHRTYIYAVCLTLIPTCL